MRYFFARCARRSTLIRLISPQFHFALCSVVQKHVQKSIFAFVVVSQAEEKMVLERHDQPGFMTDHSDGNGLILCYFKNGFFVITVALCILGDVGKPDEPDRAIPEELVRQREYSQEGPDYSG